MNNTAIESNLMYDLSNGFKRFIAYDGASRQVTFNPSRESVKYTYNPLDGRTGISTGDEFSFQSWWSLLSIKGACEFEYQGDQYVIERLYSSSNFVSSMCILTLSVNGEIVQALDEAMVLV